MNRKPTARDLLRKSREQKKQRVKAPSNRSSIRQTPLAKATPSKRRHDDDVLPTLEKIEQRPIPVLPAESLHQPDENKRQKLVDYGESESESESDSGEASVSAPTKLPAGFFDSNVPVSVDDASDDESDKMDGDDESKQSQLHSELSDNTNVQTIIEKSTLASVQGRSEKEVQLLNNFDRFESEIAGLEKSNADVRTTEPLQAEKSPDDPDVQGKRWITRTDRLLHLKSIIQEGLRGMDKNEMREEESASRMDTGTSASESEEQSSNGASDSGSDSDDFASLTNWRMPSIK